MSDQQTESPAAGPDRPTPARIVLVLLGIGTLVYGVSLVLTTLGFERIPGLIMWLAAAVLINDLVAVPLLTLVGRIFGPSGRRADGGPVSETKPASLGRAAAYSRTLVVTAMLVSVVAVPEVLAKNRGVPNPTVLPLDYAQNLLWMWIVVAAIVVLVFVVGLALSKRRD